MRKAVAGASIALLFAGTAANAEILLIDDFLEDQSVTQNGPGEATDSVASGDILGGTRDLILEVGAGGGEAEALVNSTGNDRLRYNNPSALESILTIHWDGNGSSSFDTGGLGGIDFTPYQSLLVGVFATDQEAELTFDFFSDDTHGSQATLLLPADIDDEVFSIPFASFSPIGSDGGADFGAIGAIRAVASGEPALDMQLNFIQAEAQVPAPAPLALLATGLAGLFIARRPVTRSKKAE